MGINAKEIGQRIKKLRKERKLTQEELAAELGVSTNSIARIEVGIRVPSIDMFVDLAAFFGASLDYLILGKI
jgi:transcriptional regulator with XRE-family HTH domain